MTSTSGPKWKEIARRVGGGVEVALLWNESLSLVKVLVTDRRQCHYLDFDVDGGAEKTFRLPFAEATSRLQFADVQAALLERLPDQAEVPHLEPSEG